MTDERWICGEPPPVESDTIDSIEDVPAITDRDELNEMLEATRELVAEGEGWYDTCIAVADNDLELIILQELRLKEREE